MKAAVCKSCEKHTKGLIDKKILKPAPIEADHFVLTATCIYVARRITTDIWLKP